MNDDNGTMSKSGASSIELALEPLRKRDLMTMKQAEGCCPCPTVIGCLIVLASPHVKQAAPDH